MGNQLWAWSRCYTLDGSSHREDDFGLPLQFLAHTIRRVSWPTTWRRSILAVSLHLSMIQKLPDLCPSSNLSTCSPTSRPVLFGVCNPHPETRRTSFTAMILRSW